MRPAPASTRTTTAPAATQNILLVRMVETLGEA
jgi:hypothetical protein